MKSNWCKNAEVHESMCEDPNDMKMGYACLPMAKIMDTKWLTRGLSDLRFHAYPPAATCWLGCLNIFYEQMDMQCLHNGLRPPHVHDSYIPIPVFEFIARVSDCWVGSPVNLAWKEVDGPIDSESEWIDASVVSVSEGNITHACIDHHNSRMHRGYACSIDGCPFWF